MKTVLATFAILIGLISAAIYYAARVPPAVPTAAVEDYTPPTLPNPRAPICEQRGGQGQLVFMLCRLSATPRDFTAVGMRQCDQMGSQTCLVFFWKDRDEVPVAFKPQADYDCVAEFIRMKNGLQGLMLFDRDDC